MKKLFTVASLVAAGLILAGCETPSGRTDYTGGGALAGAAVGAGAGAIIGSASGHAGPGALIGGAVGALSGALVGNAIQQSQRERLREEYPQTLQRIDQGQPLGLADIKALAKAGVSDEVIISQIRNSRSIYHLTTAEIIDLKDAGVSNKVIDFIINTASARAAPPPPQTDYHEAVVSEPPPPPVVEEVYVGSSPGYGYVWVSGYWGWYGGRWVWYRSHWVRRPYRSAVWIAPRWEHRGGTTVWISGYWH